MPRRSVLAGIIQGCAVVIGLIGVAYVVLHLWGQKEFSIAAAAPAVLALAVALGVALSMLAVSVLLRRNPNEMPPEMHRALGRVQTQIAELSARLHDVSNTCERIANSSAYNPEPQVAPITPSDLEPLYQALREIRELTLLTDSERRNRLERFRQERRASLIKQAFDLVAGRQWHQAERVVLALETEYPNDSDVSKARDYLNHARRLNEQEAVLHTTREVEELMSQSAWDQAYSRARTLLDGFPSNSEARALLMRVQREREVFQESTVHRMFDELRHDIERRMWRRALMHAEHLLERFPSHSRAEGVRKQLQTLHDNAEIEERQELEIRIQELVRSQRFEEAADLGEEVIRRYPMSPQADSLETMIPRLRQLAQGGMQEFSPLAEPPEAPERPEHPADIDEEDLSHRLA